MHIYRYCSTFYDSFSEVYAPENSLMITSTFDLINIQSNTPLIFSQRMQYTVNRTKGRNKWTYQKFLIHNASRMIFLFVCKSKVSHVLHNKRTHWGHYVWKMHNPILWAQSHSMGVFRGNSEFLNCSLRKRIA